MKTPRCIAALCDGCVGYVPTAEAFEIGGYEPNASVLVAGQGERLADAIDRAGRGRTRWPTTP